MRAATRPSLSIIKVVGIAFAGSDHLKLAIMASSISVGNVISNRFTKLIAELKLSLWSEFQ